MSTEIFARAICALLDDLDLKAKRQVIAEDEKARVRFLQERKTGHQAAKEPVINAWLSDAAKSDFSLRQRLFHAWLQKADIPAIPTFDELAEGEDVKGKRAKTFPADAKTIASLKKLVKAWLEEAPARSVEIYAFVGPYEFPEKVLALIPEQLPETEAEAEASSGVSEQELEKIKLDYEKKLERERSELTKIKKLLDSAKDKREADIAKAEEAWKRDREQLQSRLADATSFQKKLQEEVSSKSQPIGQLKRDLEDAVRQGERFSKELAEVKAALDTVSKARDEAAAKRDTLADSLKAAQSEVAELNAKLESASKELETAAESQKYFDQARAWMMIDSDGMTEMIESMETEVDVRSHFDKIFNADLAKKGSFQHRAIDLHGVWKKLLAEESEIVEEFFQIALQDALADGDALRDAASRLYDLKDSLLAREMAALALNHICNRFLDRKKAPPTPVA